MNKTVRCILGGISSAVIMVIFSFLVHQIFFEKYWEMVTIARPMESWQVMPGFPIATVIWNILIACGFAILYKGIPGKGVRKGLNFGLILYIIFIPFMEIWNYLQLDIPFMAAAAGLLHYLITFPLGGIVIAAIYGKSLDRKGSEADHD